MCRKSSNLFAGSAPHFHTVNFTGLGQRSFHIGSLTFAGSGDAVTPCIASSAASGGSLGLVSCIGVLRVIRPLAFDRRPADAPKPP
jgi:hypothetical protein